MINGNNLSPDIFFNNSNHCEMTDLLQLQSAVTVLPRSNDITKASSVTEETLNTKSNLKFLCKTCARTLTDVTICCCYEDIMLINESAHRKDMLTLCEQHKSLWKVSQNNHRIHHPLLETGTELTNEIENSLVAFFKTFKKEKLDNKNIKAHVKSPWLLHASDMISPKRVYECFNMAPKIFSIQNNDASAIGTILHEFVALGCYGELGK